MELQKVTNSQAKLNIMKSLEQQLILTTWFMWKNGEEWLVL